MQKSIMIEYNFSPVPILNHIELVFLTDYEVHWDQLVYDKCLF